MFEKPENTTSEKKEQQELITDPKGMSEEDLESYAKDLFNNRSKGLSQEEFNRELKSLLTEMSQRSVFPELFFFNVAPEATSKEERLSGKSPREKIYRSIFELCRDEEFKENDKFKQVIYGLQSVFGQNLQLIEPSAVLKTFKDTMWRKDIPSGIKDRFIDDITQVLAFYSADKYKDELLKNLDFQNTGNYTETAHTLEALKRLWISGHQGYAEDTVPDFILQALSKIEETPEANYLLSIRAKEILSTLKKSENFPMETRNEIAFELSKGRYAYYENNENLTLLPEHDNEFKYCVLPIEEKIDELINLSEEKKQEMLFDYEYLVSGPVRKMIQREFDFNLKDLSIQEQFYFLNYLKRVTVSGAETMKQFTSTHGVDGMRTFLSLERGEETLGDDIVAFGQHTEIAKTVFKYYGELLDRAERAEALVKEISDHEGEILTEMSNQVRENIINRAQRDLEEAVRAHDPSEVAKRLETYNAEAKEYVALLQEVGAGKIESIPSDLLTPKEQKEMLELLRRNFNEAYPNPEDKEFKAEVAYSLTKSFSNPNTTFRVLRDHEKIICFNRFDILHNINGRKVSYFGSFNAEPAYNGVGSVVLDKTVKDQLEKGHPIMGYCDPEQNITKKYIEKGFTAIGLYELAGRPILEIWRSKDSDVLLENKNRSVEDLLNKDNDSKDILVREKSEPENYDELKTGLALTRYFTHQKRTYLVFEPLPKNLQDTFTRPKEEVQKAA